MENNLELLPLTDDYIFKRVFAYKGNESVLKDFLEALLKIEIKGIKITNPEIIPYEKGEKRGLLDIKAEINDGTMLDVEMQMKNERNTDERATEYMGKMISEQLQVGEDYQNLKKSIVIFITNYNFLKRNSYHSVGKMKFDKTIEDEYVNMGYDEEDELASKYIEVHYIELPKFKKKELSKFTKLDQWMCIFTQNKMSFCEVAKKYGFYGYPVSKKQQLKRILSSVKHLLCATQCRPFSIFRTLKYNTLKEILQNKFILFYPYSFVQFANGAKIIKEGRINFGCKRYRDSKLETRMLVDKGGTLKVLGDVSISYGADIEVFSGGELTFKGGLVSNLNTVIVCANKIEIGKDVGFGRNITIRDNNGGHYINITGYKDSAPVIIGDKVWLCESCTIMPGAKIGDGAIIGAHSVVYGNVPAHALVSGNPAKVVMNNVLWKK